VPLHAVATIARTVNPENIRRQDLQRRIACLANVAGAAERRTPARKCRSS
jgi:hypothetical protein